MSSIYFHRRGVSRLSGCQAHHAHNTGIYFASSETVHLNTPALAHPGVNRAGRTGAASYRSNHGWLGYYCTSPFDSALGPGCLVLCSNQFKRNRRRTRTSVISAKGSLKSQRPSQRKAGKGGAMMQCISRLRTAADSLLVESNQRCTRLWVRISTLSKERTWFAV